MQALAYRRIGRVEIADTIHKEWAEAGEEITCYNGSQAVHGILRPGFADARSATADHIESHNLAGFAILMDPQKLPNAQRQGKTFAA